MTFTDSGVRQPKSTILSPELPVYLLINGQGVFIFSNQDSMTPAVFTFYNEDETYGLEVIFATSSIIVRRTSDNQHYIDPGCLRGLVPQKGAYYWFSLDAQNQRLYGGIGEPRMETVLYRYNLDIPTKVLETLTHITFTENEELEPLALLRDPVRTCIPLVVRNTNELDMDDIALGTYMPTANLNNVCQKMYGCISGPNFTLNTRDFPDFVDAIEYSIATPGMWCYEKLLSKASEFNPDNPNIKETYLRITLGENNGESPGIPYVMEIWPIGHYSPVHNHANANAIIRVLNGSINVSLYPFLCRGEDQIQPFQAVDFNENDVTWITANLNQVHQLKNFETNTKTCITIQCYMYSDDDNIHYDYFDYVGEGGKIEQYDPDSDMEFIAFKELIRKQWNERPLLLRSGKRRRMIAGRYEK